MVIFLPNKNKFHRPKKLFGIKFLQKCEVAERGLQDVDKHLKCHGKCSNGNFHASRRRHKN